MIKLDRYIKEVFGQSVQIKPVTDKALSGLPLFVRGKFSFYRGILVGQEITWAIPKNEMTPVELQNEERRLEKLFHTPVVFVFDHLDSWLRRRYIERRIPFVQPGSQLYIPNLMMQLSDRRLNSETIKIKKEKLSWPAQVAILFHLQKKSIEEKSLQDVAGLLGYSTMSLSRVVKELAVYELATIEGKKEKSIKFSFSGKSLWDKSVGLMANPIQEEWFIDIIPSVLQDVMFESSYTALARYTMLSESDDLYFAISNDKGKLIDMQVEKNRLYGKYRIQYWYYDPAVLANDNTVDKLSLFLSTEEPDDSRVAAARDELINSMQW